MIDPNDVPVATTGPLPLEVETLDYIPMARRHQYERGMDGKLRLGWVSVDDDTNFQAHLNAIASGKVRAIAPGHTPATIAAAEQRTEALSKQAAVELARLDARDLEARREEALARLEAQHAADLADLDAQEQATKQLKRPSVH